MPRSRTKRSTKRVGYTKRGIGATPESLDNLDSELEPSPNSAPTSDALVYPKRGNELLPVKRRGRLLERAPEPFATEIVAWISKGKTLTSYCDRKGKPERMTVFLWLEKDEEFSIRYKAAREIGQDAMLETCGDIADIEPETPVQATWRRYQIDAKLKILRMTNPAKYAERVALEHGGLLNLNVITGVPD